MRYWFAAVFAMVASSAFPQAYGADLAKEIRQCWNLGSLSSQALRATVTVEFEIKSNGSLDLQSIRLVSGSGGGNAAIEQAFQVARRAIIRCGAAGFSAADELAGKVKVRFHAEDVRIEVLPNSTSLIDV